MEQGKFNFDETKQEILNAIEAKDYTINIQEPDCDSSPMYYGECRIGIAGHWFACDLVYGEWSSDDEALLDDEDIFDAIIDIEGIPEYKMEDPKFRAQHPDMDRIMIVDYNLQPFEDEDEQARFKLEATKQEILKAIEAKDYKISIEEPNNLSVYKNPDGSEYIVVYDLDGCKSSNYFGECTIDIAGHWFTCDLGDGEWSCDDEDLLDDDGLIEAIANIDGVLCGEMTDTDSQIEVYNAAHKTNIKEYYWYEDDDCPQRPEDE